MSKSVSNLTAQIVALALAMIGIVGRLRSSLVSSRLARHGPLKRVRVPAVAGLTKITWLQAWGINILCAFMFKPTWTSSKSD